MSERLSAVAFADRPDFRKEGGATPGGLTLQERRGLAMFLLAGFPENHAPLNALLSGRFGLELPDPGKAVLAGDVGLLWQGPNRWLLEAPEAGREGLGELQQAMMEHSGVAVTDLSHARSVIRMTGPAVRQLLAKGSGVDLSTDAFRTGDCLLTRFSHYAVTLHALEEEQIDLYITRSFALSLWQELLDLGAEYGLRVANDL